MKFTKVLGVRIPKSAKEIRHNGITIWTPIRARYVSLGDSIAAGHGIDRNWETNYGDKSQYGVNGNKETVVVPNSYTDYIHRALTQKYGGTINTTSFARSGDKVSDLMAKLDHDRVRNTIAKAGYVTVCIGANDVLSPVLSHLDDYILRGDLADLEAVVENNLAALADDNNPNSYTALFNKLSAINPKAKCVFTTVYNPYKYLHFEEGQNGFFKPLLDLIPDMHIDIDEIIEHTLLGGTELAYFNFATWEWVSIELGLDLDAIIKASILNTPLFRALFNRMNGVSSWAENYVNRLNDVLREKITAFQAINPNFSLAETKAVFDTYPDRTVAADVHYNDIVNVEYTRGYDVADMDWGALWRDTYGNDAAQYWRDLMNKYLKWTNGFPSLNLADYMNFNLNGLATEVVESIIYKVIMPDVDPHPEDQGHYIMMETFGIV